MTTMEKLMVEIFERRNSIIEQVRKQVELYNQHLASKLLVDGVTPPPWLWNPNPSSHATKLNKDELISEILLPHPRRSLRYSSARHSLNSKSVVSDYQQVSDKALNVGDGPSTIIECHEDACNNSFNVVPEVVDSVSSPGKEVDDRTPNICSALDQSLARIQRSKSRQKALELRSSAKSKGKSHTRDEEHNGLPSSAIRMSGLDSQANEAPDLPKTCAISSQICGDEEKSEKDSQRTAKSCSFKESSDGIFVSEEKGCSVFNGSSKKAKSSCKLYVNLEFNEDDSRIIEMGEDIDAIRSRRSRSTSIYLNDGDLNKGDGQIEDKENDSPRSYAKPASYVCDSPKAYTSGHIVSEKDVLHSTFDITKGIDVTKICSMDELTPQLCSASGSMEVIDQSKVSQEVCDVEEAVLEDVSVQKDDSVIAKMDRGIVVKSSGKDGSAVIAKMDKGIVVKSSGKMTQQLDDGNEVRVSGGSIRKRRRSENVCDNELTGDPSGLKCTRLKLSTASVIPDTPDMIEDSVIANELESEKVVEDKSLSLDTNLRNGLEYLAASPPSDCFMLVKPKHLDFADTEYMPQTGERTRLEKSSSSADKEISCKNDVTPIQKISSVSQEVGEFGRKSYNSEIAGDIGSHKTSYGLNIDNHIELKSMEKDSESVHRQSFENMHKEAVETCDIEMTDVNIIPKQGSNDGSSPKLQTEEGEHSAKVVDKSANSSYASIHKDSHLSLAKEVTYEDTTCIEFDSSTQYNVKDNQNSSFSGTKVCSETSPDVTKSRELETAETSSQCHKASLRKSGNQEANCLIGSPSSKTQNLYETPIKTTNKDLKDIVLVEEATIGNKIPDVGPESSIKHHQTQSIESLREHQRNEEDELYSTKDDEKPETSFVFTHKISQLIEEAAGDNNIQRSNLESNNDSSTCIEGPILERKLCSEENALISTNSVQSPCENHLISVNDDQSMLEESDFIEENLVEQKSVPEENELDSIDNDQELPVFEGFIIDPQSENEEVSVSQDIINIDKLELPRSAIARASILEQVCKSATAFTPMSHLSSASRLHRYENVYQSVQNCLLEHTDLQGVQFFDEDIEKQFSASFSSGNEDKKLYSDYFPGFTPVNEYPSLGKIWENYSSHSGSSGKRLSSNPELTCFPIEEDPSVSETNESTDEDSNKFQEEINSLKVNNSITQISLDPPASVSAVKKYRTRGSVDESFKSGASFSGTHSKMKRKFGNSSRIKDTLSMSANGIKMSNKMSLNNNNNRSSKPKLSGKNSFRNEHRNLSEKGPYRNNIVSNVTSFVPLVQQKQQAAALCTGKREVKKVKALEAAEAAKRLEENKENERKLRKEAMKLERVRMEEKKAKEAELNKKKEEEEKRKKDAEMAAKKRIREQEEKHERETKRKRIEEKINNKKVEKEKQNLNIDVKLNNNEVKKHQNMAKKRGDDSISTANIQKPRISLKESITCADSCVNKQAIISKEKSYEISPYQCSDDEDEEMEDLPTKKFIPSWASKSCLALALSFQKDIDPDIVFPIDSFCSMDEVLLPRKLQAQNIAK